MNLRADNKNRTPEYLAWINMRTRCSRETHPSYHHYGGRGITVCTEWDSFQQFLLDMGTKPSSKHTLDRINNSGNYEPGNCRWATWSQQATNKRPYSFRQDNKTGITGISYEAKRSLYRSSVRRNKKEFLFYYGRDFFEACCAIKSPNINQFIGSR